MINFSAISKDSLMGKFLRGILKLIPQNAVLPILQGKLRGKKWIIGSGVFGYWLGTYELKEQKLFQQKVKEGDIVFDVGAHVGFYTLLASKLVGRTGRVFAFEPLPRNIFYLRKHIEMNKCDNVVIIETAVSDKDELASFKTNQDGSIIQIIDGNSELKFRVIALDDLINKSELPIPTVIKIDVEGAELKVLNGAKFLLNRYQPIIFLAVHNRELAKDCFDFFKKNNYNISPIIGNDIYQTGEIFAYK